MKKSETPAGQICPFCTLPPSQVVLANTTCLAFFDRSPVTPGHLLIISRAHRLDWFALTPAEQRDMAALVRRGKALLAAKYHPAGYNIGLNCGAVAGQTVFHCHCHLIPRYVGDTPNPRGGVRGVIPVRQHE